MERATLILPARHSSRDVELAKGLAGRLRLRELHVFWSHPGAGVPPRSPPTSLEPLPRLLRGLSVLGGAIERLVDRGGRLVR